MTGETEDNVSHGKREEWIGIILKLIGFIKRVLFKREELNFRTKFKETKL
jgi:hypothetical protein